MYYIYIYAYIYMYIYICIYMYIYIYMLSRRSTTRRNDTVIKANLDISTLTVAIDLCSFTLLNKKRQNH